MKKDRNMALKNKELHQRYWIGILIVIIVLLASSLFYDIPNLGEKLVFALTLSSVLLALLAIYFTINFNNLFSDNVLKLLTINKEIKNSSSKLFEVNKKLDKKLNLIPDTLANIDERVKNTHQLIESKLSKKELKATKKDGYEKIEWNLEKYTYFYFRLPYISMIYMYLIAKFYEVKKPLNEKNLKEMGFYQYETLLGFLFAISGLELINFHYHKKNNEIIINNCNKIVLDETENNLNDIIDFSKQEDDNASKIQVLTDGKKMVDNYICK